MPNYKKEKRKNPALWLEDLRVRGQRNLADNWRTFQPAKWSATHQGMWSGPRADLRDAYFLAAVHEKLYDNLFSVLLDIY